jgi:hypothetical protein
MALLSVCTLLVSLNQVPFCKKTLFLCYPKEATIVSTITIDLSHGVALCFSLCENAFYNIIQQASSYK